MKALPAIFLNMFVSVCAGVQLAEAAFANGQIKELEPIQVQANQPASSGFAPNPPLPVSAEGRPRADHYEIKKPSLNALIIMNRFLDPFQMEAQGQKTLSLSDVLHQAIDQNLDIGLALSREKMNKWTEWSYLGKFLPDFNSGYNLYQLNGTLPFRFAGASGIKLSGPFNVLNVGAKFYAYRGGAVMFGYLQARNNLRAAVHKHHATCADALLEASRRYYNLLLAEALLQIRISAVETSQAQLKLDTDLYEGGMATRLDVLQAKTQLSTDKQELIDQQIARREAALDLANYLNADQMQDILPADPLLKAVCLVSEDTPPFKLFNLAVTSRPELKQYEELRLAAKKGMVIAAAPLQPEVRLSEEFYGLGGSAFNGTTGGAAGAAGGAFGHASGLTSLNVLNFGVNWTLHGFGAPDVSSVVAAKWQARQAALNAQKELNDVMTQVRKAYLQTTSTKRKLEETQDKVESAEEELRLAQLRFDKGLGKNIDILKAQEDYTQALVENARALADYNISQVQLLHDSGLISAETIVAAKPLEP